MVDATMPWCKKCNRIADSYTYQYDAATDKYVIRVECHGAKYGAWIPQYLFIDARDDGIRIIDFLNEHFGHEDIEWRQILIDEALDDAPSP